MAVVMRQDQPLVEADEGTDVKVGNSPGPIRDDLRSRLLESYALGYGSDGDLRAATVRRISGRPRWHGRVRSRFYRLKRTPEW